MIDWICKKETVMVSIIIPCKNEEKNIGSLLLSILEKGKALSNVSWEAIIIDDNSSDSSLSCIGEIISDSIHVYRLNDSSGTGAARNYGISKASGKYIYFQDADDEFVGFDIIEKIISLAEKHGALICGGNMEIRDNGVARDNSLIDREYTFTDEGFMQYSDYQYDYGFTRFIYDRDFLISNTMLFPERIKYEDPIFMQNAFYAAKRFYKVPITSYILNAHCNHEWDSEEKKELYIGLNDSLKSFEEKKYTRGYINTINRALGDFKELTGECQNEYRQRTKTAISKISLWKVLVPLPDSKCEDGLFFHVKGTEIVMETEDLILPPASSISFDSYFNSFSLSKWKKYTNVNSFGLLIDAEGSFKVTVRGRRLQDGQFTETKICDLYVNSECRKYMYLDIDAHSNSDIIYFELESNNTPVKLYSAVYIDPDMTVSDSVKLAAVMTTFKREEYLYRNIKEIKNESEFSDHLYVVDNAGTVDADIDETVTVLRNPNTGGAGGFARGMMEVSKDLSECGFTHFILMDDDIDLKRCVFERLICFLRYIKDEYKDSFVGGSMLRRDKEYFLVETGAKREGLTVRGNGHGLDMRDPNACLVNDSFDDADYNAWWFCCIPVSYLRDDNYPLPLFFQWDDIDYGIRNKARVITMNGICVWHDCFESKRSAQYIYYSTRNPLIVDACHEGRLSKKEYLKTFKRSVLDQIYMYRYHEAEAFLCGVEDFLKGPDWLTDLNQDEHNRTILKLNKKMESCEVDMDRYRLCISIEDCDRLHKIVRILSLNGLLLKADRKIIIPLYAHRPVQTYRATEVLYYDEVTKRGYIAEKSIKKSIECLKKYRKIRNKLIREYDRIGEAYKSNYSYMTSREMWEKILKVNT